MSEKRKRDVMNSSFDWPLDQNTKKELIYQYMDVMNKNCHKIRENILNCQICYELLFPAIGFQCGHTLICEECWDKHHEQLINCPICQQEIYLIFRNYQLENIIDILELGDIDVDIERNENDETERKKWIRDLKEIYRKKDDIADKDEIDRMIDEFEIDF